MFALLRDLTTRERRTMIACFGGWSLDALDVQIFTFVIPSLLALWHISTAEAGVLATITLLVSAFGGWIAGALADRIGRVRVLQIAILWYAMFTFLCGFAQDFNQLFVLRALQGFGFGGEWAAGAVLMGEVIRDQYRGRAVGLVQTGWSIGWGTAALLFTLLFAFLPEAIAWRAMFWIGLAPALLVFWIRRFVEEPDASGAASRAGRFVAFVRRIAAAASGDHVARRHDGHRSPGWWLRIGYVFADVSEDGTASDVGRNRRLSAGPDPWRVLRVRRGRVSVGRHRAARARSWCRPSGRWCVMLIYMLAPLSNDVILPVGFVLGFINLMMFSPMGSFMTELFPTAVRGVAQGFCYNVGRGIGAIFPTMVGFLAAKFGLGNAIVVFSGCGFGLMIVALFLLPETRGRSLESLEAAE